MSIYRQTSIHNINSHGNTQLLARMIRYALHGETTAIKTFGLHSVGEFVLYLSEFPYHLIFIIYTFMLNECYADAFQH